MVIIRKSAQKQISLKSGYGPSTLAAAVLTRHINGRAPKD
jgi:hypothetical protein